MNIKSNNANIKRLHKNDTSQSWVLIKIRFGIYFHKSAKCTGVPRLTNTVEYIYYQLDEKEPFLKANIEPV